MKRYIEFIIVILCMTLFLHSCDVSFTRDATPDFSKYVPKGVIYSVMSNKDDLDTIFPRTTRSYSSMDPKNISNRIYISTSTPSGLFTRYSSANVKLSSENRHYELEFVQQYNEVNLQSPFYTHADNLIPGEIYRIEAAQDPSDGVYEYGLQWDPVYAVDTMPPVVSFVIEDAGIEYKDDGFPGNGFVDLKVERPPGPDDVYMIEIVGVSDQVEAFGWGGNVFPGQIDRPSAEFDLGTSFFWDDRLFMERDFNKEGRKSIQFKFSYFRGDYDPEIPLRLIVRITNLSKNYIRFWKSSDEYESSEDNPFAEPVEIYSNVKGGYGIFVLGAKSYAEVTVK